LLCQPGDAVDEVKFFKNTPVVRSRRTNMLGDLYALQQAASCRGTLLIKHSDLPMIDFFPLTRSIIVEYLHDGDAHLKAFVMGAGVKESSLDLADDPGPVTVNQIVPLQRGSLISLDSWYAEPLWYFMPDETKPTDLRKIRLDDRAKSWMRVLEVRETLVPTLDKTSMIPITILKRRGLATSGTTKTILYGYGANGWLSTPQFQGSLSSWILNGGVFVQARIRGGGERGYAWHMAAIGYEKIRSAEDLVACANWLHSHGYGDNRHLGLYAVSTGAYIAALALTNYPGHFAAAVLKSGLYDQTMTASTEIGNAYDPEQTNWVINRSPYQKLSRIKHLPALLLIHGSADEIYAAEQSRRFVAQALATGVASQENTFYMETPGDGHGFTDTYQERVARSFWIQSFFDRFLSGANSATGFGRTHESHSK
jgi:prolyl oligopeptidase